MDKKKPKKKKTNKPQKGGQNIGDGTGGEEGVVGGTYFSNLVHHRLSTKGGRSKYEVKVGDNMVARLSQKKELKRVLGLGLRLVLGLVVLGLRLNILGLGLDREVGLG